MEKEGYRNALSIIYEKFKDKPAALSLQDAIAFVGISRHSALVDKQFPKIKIGSKYIVPVSELASWMSK